MAQDTLKENIKKLQKLKSIFYDGNKHNYSIKLADKILSSNKKFALQYDQIKSDNRYLDFDKKIEQILNKMRLLLKSNDNS